MTSISLKQTAATSNFLKNVLRADSIISAISGLFLMIDAKLVAEFLGIGNGLLFISIGAGLLAYAGTMFYFSRSAEIPRSYAWFTIAADAVWVLLSLVTVFMPNTGLTEAGKWALFISSDFVLAVIALKYLGLRRLS
jgi:uncharacterized membrane-anchored protein